MKTLTFRSEKSVNELRNEISKITKTRVRGWIRDRYSFREGCVQLMSTYDNEIYKIVPSAVRGPHEDPFLFSGLKTLAPRPEGEVSFGRTKAVPGDGVNFVHVQDPTGLGTLKGHAVSIDAIGSPVPFCISIDGEDIAEGIANEFQWRILESGHPTGIGGFEVEIPQRFLDGARHEIKIIVPEMNHIQGRTTARMILPMAHTGPKHWIIPESKMTRGRVDIMRGDIQNGRRLIRQAIDESPDQVFTDFGFTERAFHKGVSLPTFRERLSDRAGLWHSSQECGANDCCKRRGLGLRNVYEKAQDHFGTTDPEVVRAHCGHWPRYFASKVFIKEYGRKFALQSPQTIAVVDSLRDMSRSDLPHRCVIKPEASSGVGIYLMHGDINLFNGQETPWEKIIEETAKIEGTPEKIIIEEFLVQHGCTDDDPVIPLDYKLHVYGGKVRVIHVDDRNHLSRDPLRRQQGWFSRDWTPSPLRFRVTEVEQPGFAKPECHDELIALGDEIATDLGDYARVDLYMTSTGIHLGEITTNTHNGVGFTDFGNMVMRQLWDLYDNPMADSPPQWR